MNDYPVSFEVERPERFDRTHVFMRLAIMIVVSLVLAFGWLVALIYLLVPVVSAAFVSRDGRDKFLRETAPRYKRYLHWMVSADSYMTLLTDRMPLDGPEVTSRMEIDVGGEPSTGSALMRLLTSIPSALLLALMSAVAVVTGIVAAIFILFREDYPNVLYRFHTGVVRWEARLLAYHASLTDEYPPFSLDMDNDGRRRVPPAEQAI